MAIDECISNYISSVNSYEFSMYEKEFAGVLQRALCCGYERNKKEWELVALIEKVVNYLNTIQPSKKGPKISTKSIFIHGPKSQVEFEFENKKTQRELGDIIFVVSVVFKGQKYFEKITINQMKKESKNTRWYLNNKSSKEQLHLLSEFPPFSGAEKGSKIPSNNYWLANNSKNLGSYCLLFSPGDFSYISAYELATFIKKTKNKKSIDSNDLFLFQRELGVFKNEDRTNNSLNSLIDSISRADNLPIANKVLASCLFSQNIYDFSSDYLRSNIGEFIHAEVGPYNFKAKKFFHDFLYSMSNVEEKKHKEDINAFLNNFQQYPYTAGDNFSLERPQDSFNFKAGGIGIVHTIVDVGEEKEKINILE